MQATPHIILDTDIGTDVDDALALAVILALLGCSRLHLLGVTTVHANTKRRGSMVLTLLALAGQGNIPVAPGKAQPLRKKKKRFSLRGFKGQGPLHLNKKKTKAKKKVFIR